MYMYMYILVYQYIYIKSSLKFNDFICDILDFYSKHYEHKVIRVIFGDFKMNK